MRPESWRRCSSGGKREDDDESRSGGRRWRRRWWPETEVVTIEAKKLAATKDFRCSQTMDAIILGFYFTLPRFFIYGPLIFLVLSILVYGYKRLFTVELTEYSNSIRQKGLTTLDFETTRTIHVIFFQVVAIFQKPQGLFLKFYQFNMRSF